MRPIEFLLKHRDAILRTRSMLNNSIKQTWDALKDELPELSEAMSYNTFKQYLTVFAEVVEAVKADSPTDQAERR